MRYKPVLTSSLFQRCGNWGTGRWTDLPKTLCLVKWWSWDSNLSSLGLPGSSFSYPMLASYDEDWIRNRQGQSTEGTQPWHPGACPVPSSFIINRDCGWKPNSTWVEGTESRMASGFPCADHSSILVSTGPRGYVCNAYLHKLRGETCCRPFAWPGGKLLAWPEEHLNHCCPAKGR